MHADRLQLSNELIRSELISWIRFSEPEALRLGDGLSPGAMGNPSGPRMVRYLLMKHMDIAERQSEKDKDFLKSSPAIVALCTQEESPEAWVKLGRSFNGLRSRQLLTGSTTRI